MKNIIIQEYVSPRLPYANATWFEDIWQFMQRNGRNLAAASVTHEVLTSEDVVYRIFCARYYDF